MKGLLHSEVFLFDRLFWVCSRSDMCLLLAVQVHGLETWSSPHLVLILGGDVKLGACLVVAIVFPLGLIK